MSAIVLHRQELEELLAEVVEISPILRDWSGWMGFCPDALHAIAEEGAQQAIESVEDGHGDTYANALRSTWLAGFILGVLAERRIDRERTVPA